jgi:ABC-2 type transport system ATP-binding protein
MSIQIRHLTKIYGPQKAVDDISFSVNAGEIVGFLGPNGAGKSTTLKIATGYLPPSAGEVHVAGFDVRTHPMEVKRSTGYLPEHNPLYVDMYVHEYLGFSGSVFGWSGKRLRNRVEEMIDLCGLTGEQNKKIESLSKGYRQRVGLAQALIHDPDVLILDEPTSGLDPNQILEIRKVIKDVSRNKTVIFSTHILQEVRALCDRVIVINRGKLVANDTLENILRTTSGGLVIVVEFESAVTQEELRSLPDVFAVEEMSPFTFRVTGKENVDLRPALLKYSTEKNLSLLGFKQEENSLERIFKELTAPVAEDQFPAAV